jgi:thioredoxin reductase (NADPH)
VYLIHRRDTLRASKSYHKQLEEAKNVEILWNRTVEKLLYEQKLTGVVLLDGKTGEQSVLELDGLFVSVGRKPATELVSGKLQLDEGGYIVADESTKTDVPGVFAAGDVRTKAVRQIVTAAADGAAAVHSAEEYLVNLV